MDVNMRNGSMHQLFKFQNEQGMADVLEGNATLEEVAQEVDTNLFVIPSGTCNVDPISFLDTIKMQELIKKAKEKYAMVLIDSAHLLRHKDAVVLAPYVDGIIVVVEEGKSRHEVVKTVLQPLEQKKANIVGVILNGRTFVIPQFIYERI